MGTTLRVGFAMGGGVSLGTFNGAALSQALKLLLLRGLDSEGNSYDCVEVDVFSGASAGSMSLAIMLRNLAQPDLRREEAAVARLVSEFPDEFPGLPSEAQETLIAAQIVQDIQEEIWVEKITLNKLLGKGDRTSQERTHLTAGLVDRGAVEALAREYLRFPEAEATPLQPIDLSRRRILGDRVLFASSIANLSPILADARSEFPAHETALLGLSDGLTSSVHQELRIFDLHFTDIFAQDSSGSDTLSNPDTYPLRWCRYHAGPTLRDSDNSGLGIGSLLESRGWAKMAATSIASGAFPLAFEPVPLERRSYEYGETDRSHDSLWPVRLKGKDRHVFTYIDGGTFNNEPVREAFRMASFMDAQSPDEEFERIIIFVDPHIVVPDPSLQLTHHGRWMLDEPNRLLGSMDGMDLKRKTSLDRLLPVSLSVLGAVLNESRVVEADKVFQTRKKFAARNKIRRQLDSTLTSSPNTLAIEQMIKEMEELLKKDQSSLIIPAGALTLEGELTRVVTEESGADGLLRALKDKSPEEIQTFIANPGSSPSVELGAWLRALTFTTVDRVMNLEGKMEGAQLVAISPALNPNDPGKLESLPGGYVSGFGGFASEIPGRYEVKVASYCAQLFLEGSGKIRQGDPPEPPHFSDDDQAHYLKELKAGLREVEKRLIHMIADSHIDILSAIPAGALRFFLGGKLANLASKEQESIKYEFRLEVPTKDFEFDGEGWADQDMGPVNIDGVYQLISFATFTRDEALPWSGDHVNKRMGAIKVDRDLTGPMRDKKFCFVELPGEVILEEARSMPYPIFVATIEDEDKGKVVGAERWKLVTEVDGLEESILG